MRMGVKIFGISNFIFGAVFLVAFVFDAIFLFHNRSILKDFSTVIYVAVFYSSSTGLFYSGLSTLFRKSQGRIICVIASLLLLVAALGMVSGIGMGKYSALRFFSKEQRLPLYVFSFYAILQIFYGIGKHKTLS
jgi:hypothetical protein